MFYRRKRLNMDWATQEKHNITTLLRPNTKATEIPAVTSSNYIPFTPFSFSV